MAFCSKCGKEISDGVQFCSGCGQPVGTQAVQASQPFLQQPIGLLQSLSSKIRTNAVIWIVIACIQFLIGMFNIAIGLILNADYEDGTTNIITGFFVIVVGVMNIIMASKDLKYSKTVLSQPIGIVSNFQPLGRLVSALVYNIFFGGVIGVVGSIYALVLRSFVLSNKAQFQAIEAEFSNTAVSQTQA